MMTMVSGGWKLVLGSDVRCSIEGIFLGMVGWVCGGGGVVTGKA